MTSTRGSDSHTFANYLDTDTAMRNTKKPLRKMNAAILLPLFDYLPFRTDIIFASGNKDRYLEERLVVVPFVVILVLVFPWSHPSTRTFELVQYVVDMIDSERTADALMSRSRLHYEMFYYELAATIEERRQSRAARIPAAA